MVVSMLNFSVPYHIEQVSKVIHDPILLPLYFVGNGIPEPKATTPEGYTSRCLCEKWWRRTLDRLSNRLDESDLIKAGRVAKHKEKYSSNLCVYRIAKKAAETKAFLDRQIMLSDAGDVVDMQTILTSSIANPTNRRAELMVRMAGFEIYAQLHGYVGEFYTLTCPSKYHRFSGQGLNDNYADLTPKEAQHYLVKQWSKIRAAYGRLDIKPFGFRVAEPHHDGCPHWHMLLFVRAEQRDDLRAIMAQYALEIDGTEPGAEKHRFSFVEIDSSIGSATGYIAKYISKNLGFSIDDPEHDTNDKSQSYGQRVKAWASVWGIRQFQQIGGASVTVWRQLRKITEALDDELLESARQAADESRWADYLQIMGGVDAKRIDHTIGLIKSEVVDKETGEIKQNRYFETIVMIFGVATLASEAITRTKNWMMFNSNIALTLLAGTSGGASRPLFAPWSSVNNCTA